MKSPKLCLVYGTGSLFAPHDGPLRLDRFLNINDSGQPIDGLT